MDLYYGVQTLRATENFPITGIPISQYPYLVNALAAVKEAAALANRDLGLLTDEVAGCHRRAPAARSATASCTSSSWWTWCRAGRGRRTNMNANEVIANRALELLGHRKGDYDVVHPNNHVNLSQSTNDVYPTALKIAGQLGHRGPGARAGRAARGVLRQGARSSATCSRWGARSCRTPCP